MIVQSALLIKRHFAKKVGQIMPVSKDQLKVSIELHNNGNKTICSTNTMTIP